MGFDIGVGVTGEQSVWGPGKQRILDSLGFDEQIGFRNAAAFIMGRNNNAVFAAKGADIAEGDPETATARVKETSGLYWLGFDVATGIFGDPNKGAQGNTAMGPGAERIRASTAEGERVLLGTDQATRGFNASFAFNVARRNK